jgi:hypothetical protein
MRGGGGDEGWRRREEEGGLQGGGAPQQQQQQQCERGARVGEKCGDLSAGVGPKSNARSRLSCRTNPHKATHENRHSRLFFLFAGATDCLACGMTLTLPHAASPSLLSRHQP